MFSYSISHESVVFMQDKPNKYVDYLSTTERLGIPQRSRLHPDTEKHVRERAGSSLLEVYLELLLKKMVLSQKLDRQAIKDTPPPAAKSVD